MIGETVANAVIQEQLGEGSRGVWWRAEKDGEAVAVHVLSDSASPAERDAFIKDAKRLRHLGVSEPEGILVPLDVDSERGAFATKLCTEGTVENVPSLRLPLNRRILLIATIAEALEKLHDRGIAHGAIAPATILLDDRYRPWFAGVEGDNLLLGTRGDDIEAVHAERYAAPEARTAGGKIDRRSDIYSLGRILHYFLTSRHPKEPDEELPRLEALSMSPAGLSRIVRKCTCAKPGDRYQEINDFLADLTKFGLHEEVGLAHPEVEERNVTGISASVLPKRFDLKERRLARQRAEKEAALLSIAPTDVPDTPRKALVGVGVAGSLALLVVAFVVPSAATTGLLVGTMIFAGLISLALPAGKRRTLLNRVVFAGAAACLVWVIDPAELVAHVGARGQLSDASSGARSMAARLLVQHGDRQLAGVDLSHANLSGLDLSSADLSGANLDGADLSNSDLNSANLSSANLQAAKFDDANLTQVDLSGAEGLTTAYCNPGTYLPPELDCAGNQLVLVEQ